jgi:ATP adenylyltransferase
MAVTKKKKVAQVDVVNAGDAKRGDYTSVLRKIVGEEICPFCEENFLIHHKKPVLFKNKHWIVTENAWPYAGTKHHFLLVCRLHIEAIEEGPEAMFSDLHVAYKKLVNDFGLKGASLVMRSGSTAYTGATVRHLHGQVIAGPKRADESTPITAIVGYRKPAKD